MQKTKNYIAVGIDGCSAGWILVNNSSTGLQSQILSHISELPTIIESPYRLFIDMPMGLGDENIPRNVEFKARKLMPPSFKSSLFQVPSRESVYCKTHEEASLTEEKITGKKLSIQSWNIARKIREIDQYLINAKPKEFHEAHPELLFYLWNGESLHHKKKTSAGIEERIDIMENLEPGLGHWFENEIRNYKSSEVKKDDLIDAMILYLSCKLMPAFESIHNTPPIDAKGIAMKLVYRKNTNTRELF